jgi:hypothetical protein
MFWLGRLRGAGIAFAAALLGFLPSVSHADVDLFSRRQACQTEAKTRIKAKGLRGRDLYDVVVERRRTYIADCMVMGPQQPASTASAPLPPKSPAVPSLAVKSARR